ncbi:MAG: pyridoxamine kinase [Clostridia bacterium]|nr:pyridoxamine kinase [Clostridia bacterium]
MDYKRVLTIQDVSCVGQCSLTVALPIISACGVETAVLPSGVLSTHTGGFSGYTFRDLTDDMPAIEEHWQKEGIKFDSVYTGYLGSTLQIDMVSHIMDTCLKNGGTTIVDPAMADNGKLYYGFDEAFVKKMAQLCAKADIIVPNITEASFMTGVEYKTEYDRSYIDTILSALTKMGAKTVILTGVTYTNDTTGVVVSENGQYSYYEHKKLPGGCHGTGDVYASAFVGALMRGFSTFDSAALAADYTLLCIEKTLPDAKEHWYGVKFETCIPELVQMINK